MAEPMQLKPRLRARKQRGTRYTRKQGLHKQRGGADWPTFRGDRTAWEEELTKVGLWGFVSELFNPSGNDSKRLRHYLNAIMMQDELMEVAMTLTRIENGVTGTFESITDKITDIDSKNREDFLKYVIDVQRMCSFTEEPLASIKPTKANRSKLEQIRKETAETNSSLLLFPDRLQNIFIKALATIAIQMKYTSPSLIKDVKMDNDTIASLQADLYTSYIEGFAKMKTGLALRDGFFLDERTGEFSEYIYRYKFLLQMIKGIRSLIKGERNAFTLTCNTYNTTDENVDFMKLTADILYTYIEAGPSPFNVNTILNTFAGGTCTEDILQDIIMGLPTSDDYKYIPNIDNGTLYKTPIEGTTVSYLQLLSHMRPYALNYMIHLCHTIQKLEPSVKSLVEPPMAAIPSTGAAAGSGGP